MKARNSLACLWVLFLVRGLFYVSFTPLWEGFDEWAHYAVVQKTATSGRALIGRDELVSHEVQASLELAPGVEAVTVRQDSFWRLPDDARALREQKLRSMPAQWAREPAIGGAAAYEAMQTPLYYWLFAPLYRLTAGFSFLTRVWILRFLGLLVASAVIPLGFLTARKILADDLQALGVCAVIAALPESMMTVTTIGNQSLAVAMGSLLLFVLFRWKEEPRSMPRALALGVVFGLALLTKAFFLALVPPVFVFVAIWAKREGRLSAGPRCIRMRGHHFGLVVRAQFCADAFFFRGLARNIGERIPLSALDAARKMNWRQAIDFVFLSHIWLGNWSFLVVRSWMYRVFAVLAVLAGVGLILRRPPPSKQDLWLLASLYLTLVAAVGYFAIRTFQSSGFSGSLGHYLYALVVAEVILVTAGLRAIAPAVIPGGVICLAALEFFGIHFYLIPYYTGFTAHIANGGVPALGIHQLRDSGLRTMLTRLAEDKASFLTPTAMGILWLLFLAATLGLIVISIRLQRTARSSRKMRRALV